MENNAQVNFHKEKKNWSFFGKVKFHVRDGGSGPRDKEESQIGTA